MRIFLTLLFLSCTGVTLNAQAPFITIWNTSHTSNAGTTNTQILYPNSGGTYHLLWTEVGNPSYSGSLTTTSANTVIEFGKEGIYEIQARPAGATATMDFNMPAFGNRDNLKLVEVTQWGDYTWHIILTGTFYNCSNMDVTATDKPVFSTSARFSLADFFNGCIRLENNNGSIGTWETGNVINLNRMFYNCTKFNQNLNSWVTNNVTSMESVFAGCTLFNQPLDNWNTENVTSFRSLFYNCTAFNQNINGWKTDKVTDLSSVFLNCTQFNQPLNLWVTAAVTTLDRSFGSCTSFNQDISNWNVENVRQFTHTFSGATNFNQPLTHWVTASAQNMTGMFNFATRFNQPLPGFITDAVTDLSWMFFRAEQFNQPIGSWNTASVKNFSSAFMGASSFDQDLAGWSLESADNLELMLSQSGLSCMNYRNTLRAWANHTETPANLNLGATDLVYGTEGQIARDQLITTKNWTFTGDQWDASCSESLPVIFDAFSAHRTHSELVVNWISTFENNNSYFEIQISADGKKFKTIGKVLSQAPGGNASAPLHYQFSTRLPEKLAIVSLTMFALLGGWGRPNRKKLLGLVLVLAGLWGCQKMTQLQDNGQQKIYVRILQNDKDGKQQQSRVIVAENPSTTYPSPF